MKQVDKYYPEDVVGSGELFVREMDYADLETVVDQITFDQCILRAENDQLKAKISQLEKVIENYRNLATDILKAP